MLTAARQFAPNGLDAVLLTTGGETAEKSLAALRNGGRAAHPNGVQPIPKRAGIKVQS
jgi:NADPH2:quinone reductase